MAEASGKAKGTGQWRDAAGGRPGRILLWAALGLLAVSARSRPAADFRGDAGEGRGESGHGRLASTPSQIPARGWKDIVVRVYKNISAHRVLAIAAGVTFYSLLAIFPAIAALVSIYGLFADASTISGQADQLSGLLPGGAVDVLKDQLSRVSSQQHGTLGLTFAIGVIAALWSANSGVKALIDALNIVYAEDEKRGFIRLNAISLAFTLATIVLLLIALAAVVAVPPLLAHVSPGPEIATTIRIVRWPILFVIVTLLIAVLYRYGPSRNQPQWHWVTWGSALATLLWIAASLLFSWYTANFGSYNKTYGSLGAIIGFMIWIWISAIVVLIGAEVDAETEHQTARDTTIGGQKSMGRRGAKMADTLGARQG